MNVYMKTSVFENAHGISMNMNFNIPNRKCSEENGNRGSIGDRTSENKF